MISKNRTNTIVTIENAQANRRKLQFSDFIIPILGVCIFILLVMFVYIPSIKDAVQMREELNKVKSQSQHLEELESQLKLQDSAVYESDFADLSLILPKKLEVANFAYYVDELAVTKGLGLNKLTVGNYFAQQIASSGDSYKITGPIEYTGSYENIISFLDQMQEYSPYIITIDSFKLVSGTSESGDTIWNLSMTISAIYGGLYEFKIPSLENYTFLPYSSLNTDLELLKSRAERIKSNKDKIQLEDQLNQTNTDTQEIEIIPETIEDTSILPESVQ